MTPSIAWWSPQMTGSELPLVEAVLDSNYVNDGEVTEEFERRIAKLVGAKHAIGVTSGTSAIYLSLVALGIGPGDEVIVPDVTFIATANAAAMTGASPVLVDVDPKTLNISVSALEAAITPKTRAVVPVHVSGRAADMEEINRVCSPRNIAVVEDAAEALCSQHKGRGLGTFGRTGCFSFSPNKTITTGQGGIIVTEEDGLAQRLRQLKDQGRPVRGTGGDDAHPALGFNFKLTNLQSAVGLGQLEKLAARLERIRSTYRIYRDELEGVIGIRVLPFDIDHGEQPQWIDALADRRNELDAFLAKNGAGCRRFWFPLHTQKPYLRSDFAFPNSTRLCKEAIWLPSAFQLSDEDVMHVSRLIREFYKA
jgi:perosamine synthetase